MCKRFIIDKQTALKMCKKKLKRTSKLYKKVLIINTLRFIQNSNSIIKYHVSKKWQWVEHLLTNKMYW